MPRYFVDWECDKEAFRDLEGQEMNGPESARAEAISLLPEIARSKLSEADGHRLIARVRDDNGLAIFEATLTFEGYWLDVFPEKPSSL